MKVSNETKIGALTAITVVLLILGFNFLKGKSLFKTGNFLYAKYNDAKKLNSSDPVYINGFQVGTVYGTEVIDNNLSNIVVAIKLNSDYKIPNNSLASIESNPLGGNSVDIKLGNSTTYLSLSPGDTILSTNEGGLLAGISSKLVPVADQLKSTLASLDTVLRNVNTVLDPNTKGNLQNVIGNLSKATANMVTSTASLQSLLNTETGALARSLDSVSSFTKNLAANNGKITSILGNLDSTTAHLSRADIQGIADGFKASAAQLQEMLTKANSPNSSIGSLINSRELADNLNKTIASLHILMDDLRVHPKRYVNISVFGKKDKGNYLTAPLATDSTTTPVKP